MGASRSRRGTRKWGARPVAGALLAFWLLASGGAVAQDAARIAKGEYLTRAGGCVACHTDLKGKGPELAGGHALKTPFGTYFSPNITPDRETGIGTWSDADFLRALRQGLRPDGAHYYPVFPYPSYTGMTDEDVGAIKAYLFSRPAVKQANKEHQVGWPFSIRPLLLGWKLLFFKEGAFKPRPGVAPEINRGAYLVDHVAHCGECHTPRNVAGAMDRGRWLAGTADGPGGERVPNITPDKATGLGDWSVASIAALLKDGTKPDFDNVQGTMAEAIEHGLKYLSDADLQAMAAHVKSVKPVVHKVARKN